VHLGRDVTLYVLARLGMVAAVMALLMSVNVPLLVAMAVGVVVALPLSLFILKGLRARVAAGLNARGEVRKAERERLRAQLRGETA
jgi:cob(I)alamin adenosyltransferase